VTFVNFGCGRVFHSGWLNFDSSPCDERVSYCDISGRLPFGDQCVDVIYHSHVLEHLEETGAKVFIDECRRILRPGGIMRVVVPDLEGIAGAYLQELQHVKNGFERTLYDWCRMELTDQAARSVSGGSMLPYIRSLSGPQLELVRKRAGMEVDSILTDRASRNLRSITAAKVCRRIQRELVAGCAWLIGGPRMRSMFYEGWFRHSGEIHRVMYDQVSLSRLLVECGFVEPARMNPSESLIPGFNDYALDMLAENVRKPDSLFMEAIRP
jgi:hypothetical protein